MTTSQKFAFYCIIFNIYIINRNQKKKNSIVVKSRKDYKPLQLFTKRLKEM